MLGMWCQMNGEVERMEDSRPLMVDWVKGRISGCW